MKRFLLLVALVSMMGLAHTQAAYVPSKGNLDSRRDFEQKRFGIFLHWGTYSIFAQGEWYLHAKGGPQSEYRKAADAFYPHRFDARSWVKAIKDAGAGYICFTTRHHDGFSMWDTDCSDYNIVDASPYGRDVLKDLARECHRQGIRLHLYYSLIDWGRTDYPRGYSGLRVEERDIFEGGWPHYYDFMNRQITELLTRYGKVDALWFDGVWDHAKDEKPFDWQLEQQYALIHSLQPDCMVGNNHHLTPIDGEDFQIFERDLPGENKAGLSGQAVSDRLPLETCQTMNKSWGYKVTDTKYKSTEELIRYLVSTAAKGANLLLNIGPQPNGELPQASLERLRGMGEWLGKYGKSVYGTTAGDIPAQPWGVTTRKGDRLYVHIFDLEQTELELPLTCRVVGAKALCDDAKVRVTRSDDGVVLHFEKAPAGADYVVELRTK